ncbi:sirohydrochlorin cobaltochelatase [Photobacterium lipolyticum]|uniref:Sirohydrochlorin cobaltochelatase n=1 Tax=Photobacterium lipolyticum TaxID=266810 RepID=A0A2T3N2N2_9GAMM|nr:sirohydrochlorin cobaltochelatase [Photobacterium lipolyticum]PSW06591.1 sirohydrochlorin cobaltochelatase [Photobacterium lipolyticum]
MKKTIFSLAAALMVSNMSVASAATTLKKEEKSAIVLAAFGTTYDSAVGSLLGIKEEIENAYPNTPVRFAFTSNMIRKKWHSRQDDAAYKAQHPEIPQEFYDVKNVLGAMADFQNEGYKNIVVQTTLLSHGEEFIDLKAYVDALASIETLKTKWKPFNSVALGRPLMGTWGNQYEYRHDMEVLVEALAGDVKAAEKANSALVYMGHGNDHLSTGLYYELEELMNEKYPEVKTYVGLVEGHPNFDTLLDKIKRDSTLKVMIKPLMVVAGDHATNDMAGDEEDSWKVMLSNAGISVTPVLEGLGSRDSVQKIYLQHLNDAAKDTGIELK